MEEESQTKERNTGARDRVAKAKRKSGGGLKEATGTYVEEQQTMRMPKNAKERTDKVKAEDEREKPGSPKRKPKTE